MAHFGIYTNGVIKTKSVFKENQKVIITPIKETAFGILHKYANPELIPFEDKVLHDELAQNTISDRSNDNQS